MKIQIRTKEDLAKLLNEGVSAAWRINKERLNKITDVEIYNFSGNARIVGTFDRDNTKVLDNGRVAVAFTNAEIEPCDFKWVGQNPIKYKSLDNKEVELMGDEVDEDNETHRESVDENSNQAYYGLIRVPIKNFELSDYDSLCEGELGMYEIQDTIELNLPDYEISYYLISANEESIEIEGECIHWLWCEINIGNEDPDEFIPNNEDSFLTLSSEIEDRICCYVVPESFMRDRFYTKEPDLDIINDVNQFCNERYMSYWDGDYDSGFYM